jgi:hypothetical protein
MDTMDLYWMTILHVYSKIIMTLNVFDIMDTLSVYFKYIKVLCNVLQPYTSLYKLFYYTSW